MSESISLRRLNQNQLSYRRNKVLSALGDIVADQVYQILTGVGLIERMRSAGLLESAGGDAPTSSGQVDLDTLSETALRHALECNDVQAIRLVDERKARAEAVQAFNVRVEIVPYSIADTSLERIVMEADAPVVRQIVMAAAERARLDNCPMSLRDDLVAVCERWHEWAKLGLKPRKRLEDGPETETVGSHADTSVCVPA